MKGFLRANAANHGDDRALGKQVVEQGGDEGMGGVRDADERQRFSRLDAPDQCLDGGGVFKRGRERPQEIACRRFSQRVRFPSPANPRQAQGGWGWQEKSVQA